MYARANAPPDAEEQERREHEKKFAEFAYRDEPEEPLLQPVKKQKLGGKMMSVVRGLEGLVVCEKTAANVRKDSPIKWLQNVRWDLVSLEEVP